MTADELAMLARSDQGATPPVATPAAEPKRRRRAAGQSRARVGRHAERRRRRRPNQRAVRPTFEPAGPHVLFGIGWALVTLAAIFGGTVWLALWMALAAALAAGSAIHSWPGQRSSRRPLLLITGGLAAAIVLAAIAGPIVAVVVGVAVVVFILASAPLLRPGSPGVVRRVLIVVAPAAAGAGLVLARHQGFDEALVLAGMMVVYDSAAYLVGTGANNRWEGPIAGMVSVGILSVLVAAVLVPPF
ncbi:MAG TPA: hypothetical protein VLL25_05615, partial [Acidimicrobiales bacterium]|nr:hypothetical protein [Acidimicrobiales bacterium]